jgi:hypothetical protein
VKHYLYCSAGNTEGLDEYLAFFEIAEEGHCSRYVEIHSVGHVLKYTEDEPADEFGALPEGPWNAHEAAKSKYGTLTEISQQLFNSAWKGIRVG